MPRRHRSWPPRPQPWRVRLEGHMADGPVTEQRTFTIEVLGRTLEHLGTQMYKHRDAALAELIANCWDAGATWVELEIPLDGPLSEESVIRLSDDGGGMSPDQVETDYLV